MRRFEATSPSSRWLSARASFNEKLISRAERSPSSTKRCAISSPLPLLPVLSALSDFSADFSARPFYSTRWRFLRL
jgi:hypothetical protein